MNVNGSAPTAERRPRSTRRHRPRSPIPVVVTVLALAAAGCSAGGKGGSASSAADISAYGREKNSDVPSSPLTNYLGFGDPKKQQAQVREQMKKQQAIIAACMTEQGFDYIPFTPDVAFFFGQESFGDLTRKEFADKWGFAISTTMSADGTPVEGTPFGRTSPDDEDPNQKVREAMSEGEGAAYDKALNGSGGDGVDDSSSSGEDRSSLVGVPDFESMGCQGKAFASQSGLDPKDERVVQKAFEELSKRVEADKRTKAATSTYRACMAAAGFPEIKKPNDAYEKVASRMEGLYGTDPGSVEGSGEGAGASSDTTIAEGAAPGPGSSSDVTTAPALGAPPVDSKKLKDVQRYELSLAKAELPCRAAFTLATAKVQAQYEEEFITKNKDALDKARAAGGTG